MHTVHRLYAVLIFLATAFAGTLSHAAVTTFTDRSAWQAAAGPSTNFNFATKDDGTPISSPPADVRFSTLTLRGVTFLNVNAFENLFLYVEQNAVMRILLPANTSAYAADMVPVLDDPGTYTIKLSTGEVLTRSAGSIPESDDFFGVVSTTPIEWIEISLNSSFLGLKNFSFVAPTSQQVRIDIRPSASNEINPVNPGSNGVIPVSLLSSSTFDATQVYLPSVRFGRTGMETPITTHSYQDTNGDGKLDLVMQFHTQSTGIQCGDTVAKLTGQTTGGTQFTASDAIRTVGCK